MITIISNDVVFGGAGHTITGGGIGNSGIYGISVFSGTTNVTVKNLNVTNWYLGISYNNVQNGNLLKQQRLEQLPSRFPAITTPSTITSSIIPTTLFFIAQLTATNGTPQRQLAQT
jgi:hypothetical protein